MRTRSAGAAGLLVAMAALVPGRAAGQPPEAAKPTPSIVFEDMAASAGVSFRFQTGARGKHDLPEVMGGGVAILDADGDGLPDLYFCNGGPIGDSAGRPDPVCRLYRNRGGWQFEEITERAGAPGPSYAMGAAVGDYDGDGRDDLFVTGWRDQRLYRNLGGGRFRDVTQSAGLTSDLWSTAAAFADLDGDGDPDLYVATYVDYDAGAAPFCAAPDGARDYCGPEDFSAQPDRLYRNNGDGTFTDVSKAAGIDLPRGRGLGVLVAELTGDNRPDIYVANDSSACWLFANRGDLRFEEIGEESGVARDGDGQVLSGMGVAQGDLDADGLLDLVVANFYERSTIAFRAQAFAPGLYRDASSWLGLTAATRQVNGFGLALADLDGDGRVDVLQNNGHVLDRARLGVPFAMRPTLLHNAGIPLREASDSAGPWFRKPCLGRGLAVADLDGDGRPDAVAASLDAPAALLRNTSHGGRSLSLELVDRAGRPSYGARALVVAGGEVRAGALAAGGSYLSASQPRVWLGLGKASSISSIQVDWPWGTREVWSKPTPSPEGLLRLRQGTGRAVR